MKENTLNSFLDEVGITPNTWVRPTNLHYIILESAANQFFNPKLQKIYFDTSKELIKIKYSDLIPITAFLKQFSYNAEAKTLYFTNAFQSVYYKKTIREPKAGDKVFCYQPSTKELTNSTIARIETDMYGNKNFVLLDDNIITIIQTTTSGLRFFIWLQEYETGIKLDSPTEYYVAKDLTEYDADIYLGVDRVSGFNFNEKTVGL